MRFWDKMTRTNKWILGFIIVYFILYILLNFFIAPGIKWLLFIRHYFSFLIPLWLLSCVYLLVSFLRISKVVLVLIFCWAGYTGYLLREAPLKRAATVCLTSSDGFFENWWNLLWMAWDDQSTPKDMRNFVYLTVAQFCSPEDLEIIVKNDDIDLMAMKAPNPIFHGAEYGSMHLAISNDKERGHEKVLLLLKAGMDPNADNTSSDKVPAIISAAKNQRLEVVKILFENGASIHKRAKFKYLNKSGYSVYEYCSEPKKHAETPVCQYINKIAETTQ